jgi:hypothetical protein
MNATLYPRTPTPLIPRERYDLIARRAYEKWVSRGCLTGTALQDWTEAEAEVDENIKPHEEANVVHWPHLSDTWHLAP